MILNTQMHLLMRLLLSLVALAFHDSAGPLLVIVFFSISFARFLPDLARRMNYAMMLTAVIFILLGPKLNVVVINLVQGIDIGIRSAYLQNPPNPSKMKMIFGFFVLTHTCLFVKRRDVNLTVQTCVAVSTLLSATVFVLNETAAIRTFLFPLCIAVAARNSFLFTRPQRGLFRLLDWATGLFFCLMSFYDMIRERAAP